MDARPAGLSNADIDDLFEETQNGRRDRAQLMVDRAKEMQQMHAQETLMMRLIARIVLPTAGLESTVSMLAGNFVGGGRLEHLAVPKRPRAHPFVDELPAKPVKTWIPQAVAAIALGLVGWSSLQSSGLSGYGLSSLRSSVPNLAAHLSPSGRQPSTVSLLSNVVNTLICTIEGYRVCNRGTILSL